jgi:NAD(P)-dependent dehydrogenase (short-subunit alcohol dehydrogenase family)
MGATQKITLVTGASRGLGAALAEALAAQGHHIMAVARTTGALEELDDRIKAQGGQATLAPMDVTSDGAMQHLCRSIHDRWGGIDFWCHTAVHAAPLSPLASIDGKDWAKSIAVNVEATRRLIAYVSPLLLAREGGTAVFFDDSRAGQPFFGSYGATKAAQMALVRSWQAETRRIGPRVEIVTPAPMPTATRARFFPGEDRSILTAPSEVAADVLRSLGIGV